MENEIAQISVYLAKEKRTFETVIDKDSDLEREKGYRSFDFNVEGCVCRFIYFEKASTKKNPPWLTFINDQLDEKDRINFAARSQNANGILMVSLQKRIFVALFGRSASSHLNKRSVEPDFGIKTAMNMCGNEEVRQTKSQSNSIAITQIDRQVSKPSDTFAFGLSEAEDLKYISAQMKGEKNITLQGRDNLTLKVIGKDKLNWERLIKHFRKFLQKFSAKDFVDLFPNYKNLDPATEQEAASLDGLLINALRAEDFSKIRLSIPEFISDDEYCFSFTNNASRENVIYAYLEISQLKTAVKLREITIKKLLAKKIYAYSPEDDRVIESKYWHLYDCLVCEQEFGGQYFVLGGGQWRKIEPKFYNSIIQFTKTTLQERPCEAMFKDIDISDDKERKNKESIFNAKVVQLRPVSILFDRAKLKIGGSRSDKEFCDILDLQDDDVIRIVNSKQYKDAASISYLFLQTKFYSEAFLTDPTFLDAIRGHIENGPCQSKAKYLKYIKTKNEEVNGSDYRLCLWLLYNRNDTKPDKSDLPIMAQYELKLMHDHLRRVCKFRDIILRFVPVQIKQYTRGKTPKKKKAA